MAFSEKSQNFTHTRINGTGFACKQTRPFDSSWELTMLGTILLVVLVLMLLGAAPAWPHSRQWGYAPTGALGTVLVVVLILVLLGRI